MTLIESPIPWREKPTLSVRTTSDVGGWSKGHTYSLITQGKLEAVIVAGKTAITTESLIRLLDNAEPWSSRKGRVQAANRARSKPRELSGSPLREHGGRASLNLCSRARPRVANVNSARLKPRKLCSRFARKLSEEAV
jgi:hypothetical protein